MTLNYFHQHRQVCCVARFCLSTGSTNISYSQLILLESRSENVQITLVIIITADNQVSFFNSVIIDLKAKMA